jgi:hypothetical protein
MPDPLRGAWLADPLAIDVALQAVILWSRRERNRPCLPCGIGRYRQFRRTFPREGVRVVVTTAMPQEHLIRARIELRDLAGQPVALIEDCDNILDHALAGAFAQKLLEAQG